MREKRYGAHYLILAGGVLSVSVASTLIKLANINPFLIAFYRMFLSSLLLLPFFLYTLKKEKSLCVDSGFDKSPFFTLKTLFLNKNLYLAAFFLALHFILWISSLFKTSVLSSLIFVTMNPIFVSLFDFILLKEKTHKGLLISILIATSGGVLIFLVSGSSANFGNLLAILGSVAVSLYFVIGRKERKNISAIHYNFIVFFLSSIFILIFILILTALSIFKSNTLISIPFKSFIYLFLLALISQNFGHGLINFSLKFFKPQFVALMILFEPIFGTAIAFIVFKEVPLFIEISGSILILTGIVSGILSKER